MSLQLAAREVTLAREHVALSHGRTLTYIEYGADRRPGRSLLDWAEDVDRLADTLGIERFSVLGFSFGGRYSVACAYRLADQPA